MYLFRGRRRKATSGNYYVDRPSRRAWLSSLLLVCLSLLDAILSLILFTDENFHEMNPLLWLGLQYGDHVFLLIKFLLTFCSIFVLLIHWNFVIVARRVRVAVLIRLLIGIYALIVVYEVLLLSRCFGRVI